MRERGTVISWNNAEGYGRIQSDAGDVLWSHFSFINMDGFKALGPGPARRVHPHDRRPCPTRCTSAGVGRHAHV